MTRTPDEESEGASPPLGRGYAHFQLARALITAESHDDPAVRERAAERMARWKAVLLGMLSGSISIGARAPVTDTPAWATLEVVTGGFATGAVLSAGPLLDHERELLAELGLADAADPRRVLNTYFLSDQGLPRLQAMLDSGRYDVQLAEEGALLTVAWLLGRDRADAARRLVEVLAPYFGRMRFYPVPVARPQPRDGTVWLEDVATTMRRLQQRRANTRILAQREAIEVWAPLYDRVVALFLETVAGETPVVQRGEKHGGRVGADGRHVVAGGWPCAHYPLGWVERAQVLLSDLDAARTGRQRCTRQSRRDQNMGGLFESLRRCAQAPQTLANHDVGRIRLALARYVAKRGLPDSELCRSRRAFQARHALAPTHHDIAKIVVQRLVQHSPDAGLDDVAAIVEPVSMGDGLARVPPSIAAKVQRCHGDTPAALVERKVITSGEVLANVLPQITSALQAQGFDDSAASRLYAAVYRAFRKRRSLLLVDLQKQVQLRELPWMAALEAHRTAMHSTQEVSRRALADVTTLAISAFAPAILPNKLLREIGALARDAAVDVPVTEEVAADIFMGRFSPKFPKAAAIALQVVAGTPYARYYDIDPAAIGAVLDKAAAGADGRKAERDEFAELCASRAGASLSGWGAAKNGKIIEQQQILTTHNLAPLISQLGLAAPLQPRLDEMIRRCFDHVIKTLQLKTTSRHAKLIHLKNSAYAWRQMIFLLSLQPASEVDRFIVWADAQLGKQPSPFRTRFQPAFERLAWASKSSGLADERRAGATTGLFLGWSTDRHWLMSD
jgi:hypothetical protein